MMNEFKNILVAIDTRREVHPVVTESVELAQQNGGKLHIVDVAPEFPWTVKLTMPDHEHIHSLVVKEKSESLEKIASPLRETGLEVTTNVLEGKSSVEIIREVTRNGHDLVMRAAKGSDSRSSAFFGNTGSRLLRQCPCSVWLVSENTRLDFKHLLACVNTSSDDAMDQELNQRVFDLASMIQRIHQSKISIIHSWNIWNEQMLKGRLGQERFAEVEQKTLQVVNERLDDFLSTQQADEINVALKKGDTDEVITEFAKSEAVDLIILGTVAKSGVTGIVTGSCAEEILNQIECSVLALKPSSFVSPVQLD